jgi:hypothetical protein
MQPETFARRVLLVAPAAAVGVVVAVHFRLMLWARHELVPYEPVVAAHVARLAQGAAIYSDLSRYPYTVATYTPGFYAAAAALHRLACPFCMPAGWRLLGLHTRNRYAAWAGTLAVASTANLLYWGTVCRVDVLALFFALAAFDQYSRFAESGELRRLVWAGLLVSSAVLTRQTMLLVGVVVILLLARQNLSRALAFGAALGLCVTALAVGINYLTAGRFWEHTVLANLNPFSPIIFQHQVSYFLLVCSSLIVLVLAGLRRAVQERFPPLHLYLALAAVGMAATWAKFGADYNYQLETTVLLALCAAWGLDRLEFFPRFFQGDRSMITLMHVPLLLFVVLNIVISAKHVVQRLAQERIREQEFALLRPYLERSPGPVLSVHQGPLLHLGKTVEVEPFMYRLLVEAGRADPELLRRDLARRRFAVVILYEDVFRGWRRDPSLCSLPDVHLEELRRNYRLVNRIPGPVLDNYVYQPLEQPGPVAQLNIRARATVPRSAAATGSSPSTGAASPRAWQ